MSQNNFSNYLSTHFRDLGGPHRMERRQESLRANYLKLLPSNRGAPALEIGPGMGELLQLLTKEWGLTNVEAIDISAEVAEHCSRTYCRTTFVEDPLDFLSIRPATYELVMLLHVLEHVEKSKIIQLLQGIHSALQPGGRVIIEVPNMGNPLVGLTYRYADFTHEVGFTGSSLAQALRISGFEDIAIRPFRIPRSSLPRLIQYSLRACTEGALKLLTRLYSAEVEINSANIVAIASRTT